MSQVLGCKVNDDLYNRFSKLEGSISDNLRKAIENHINNMVNRSVNDGLKAFSHGPVVERVDRLIVDNSALFAGSGIKQDSEEKNIKAETREILNELEMIRNHWENKKCGQQIKK